MKVAAKEGIVQRTKSWIKKHPKKALGAGVAALTVPGALPAMAIGALGWKAKNRKK